MFWSEFGYRTNSLWLACVLLVSVGGVALVVCVCVCICDNVIILNAVISRTYRGLLI